MPKEIEINGVVSVPEHLSHEEFLELFIEWVESHNFTFGGGTTEFDKNGNPV